MTLTELTAAMGPGCLYVVCRGRVQPMAMVSYLDLQPSLPPDAEVRFTERGAVECAIEQRAATACDVCWASRGTRHRSWCPEPNILLARAGRNRLQGNTDADKRR